MKGFLHRIAASAVRPQPSLHPFVESIYAAPRTQDAPEPGLHLSSETAPVRPPATQGFSPTPRSQEAQPVTLGRAEPRTEPPAQILRAQHDSQQTLLPPQPSELEIPAERSRFRRDVPETASVSRTQTGTERLRERVEFAATPEFVPLLPERAATVPPSAPEQSNEASEHHAIRASARENLTHTQQRQAASPRAASSRTVAPAAHPASEDVQIHIGRIEVIAVPPPAPRPAAALARKGLNLDDYLSRRNGRAG